MRRAVYILALLVVLSPLPGAATAAEHGPSGGPAVADTDASPRSTPSAEALQMSPLDPHTVVRVYLQPDRDARWVIRFEYRLGTQNRTTAFRQLKGNFEAGEPAAGPSVALFRTAAEKASTVAGREMRIVNENRTGTVDGDTGTLTLQFTWTNFLSRGPDASLRLGDAFRTPDGGRWITSLGEGQRIMIVTPEGYSVNSTSFQLQLQNNSVIIDGPRSLPQRENLVVVYRETSGFELPWSLLAGGAMVAVLAAVAVAYFRREDGTRGERDSPAVPGESTDGGVGVDDSSGGGSPDDSADGDDPADGEVDLSLLSDEERIERLLERNGGRMKQATIVTETGWSDAKVSQLLSAMTDEGRIEKLRLGRENLISLPDADDEDA